MRIWAILALAAIGGCGNDNPSVTVGNMNPLGTVGGVIYDGASEMGLMGAMVKLTTASGSLTATTDKDGVFSIAKVPAGSFVLTVSNMGYETAIIEDSLSGSVGNFPVQNPQHTIGPVGLLKNDGTFSVKLLDQYGAPVSGVSVVARPQVRWIDYSSGGPTPHGTYQVTAMSGMDGTVMLSGLPEYATLGAISTFVPGVGNTTIDVLPIDVAPMQVMSMPPYPFLGGTFTFSVLHLSGGGSVVDAQVIRLAGPSTDLTILDSNVDYLRGQYGNIQRGFSAGVAGYIGANGPINATFNQAINKNTIRATLFQEDGTLAPVQPMATVTGNQLSITPMSALTAGQRYNLALHVDAASQPGESMYHEVDVTAPLFIAPAAGTKLGIAPTVPPKLSSDKFSFTFAFTQPVGAGFAAQAVSCVVFYDINASIGLDNDPSMLAPGEWATNGVGVSCPSAGALDITAMSSLEGQASGMPITGFSSKWSVTFDNTAGTECKGTSKTGTTPTCSPPAPGTAVHFIFSRPNGASTIRFPDGTPVTDDSLTLNIPTP